MPEISRANRDDVPELTEMWDEFMEYHRELREWAYTLDEGAHDRIDQRFLEYMDGDDKLVLTVTEHDEPAGFAVARVEDAPDVFDVGDKVRITDFYLRPPIRGQNVGTQLVNRITEWGRGKGAEKLFMSIDAENEAGRAFWEALGFECTRQTYLTDL